MRAIKFLPITLGGIAVLQAGMNKIIAQSMGLSTAALINGAVFALCAVFVFLLTYFFPGFFSGIIPFNHSRGFSFHWWYLIPGIIGFSLVFFLPLVIMEAGALPVFLGVIAGQIIVGILWDAHFEKIPVDVVRVAGALMTFAGALLVIWKK
ncbi:MAG: DMT family transporter [Smithellaceae bacterium]